MGYTNLFTHAESILLKAFQSILSDPDFDVPSQPAIAARKSASLILLWCRTYQDETSAFLSKLQKQLSTCFASTAKNWAHKRRGCGSSSLQYVHLLALKTCGRSFLLDVVQMLLPLFISMSPISEFKDLLLKQFSAAGTWKRKPICMFSSTSMKITHWGMWVAMLPEQNIRNWRNPSTRMSFVPS